MSLKTVESRIDFINKYFQPEDKIEMSIDPEHSYKVLNLSIENQKVIETEQYKEDFKNSGWFHQKIDYGYRNEPDFKSFRSSTHFYPLRRVRSYIDTITFSISTPLENLK